MAMLVLMCQIASRAGLSTRVSVLYSFKTCYTDIGLVNFLQSMNKPLGLNQPIFFLCDEQLIKHV